jgi:hypothetical protein
MDDGNMINTDMNIYSMEDLIVLLELEEDFTKEDVIEKVNFLNKKYFENNEEMIEFFNNIQNKLIDDINDNLNENVLPDYGSLIETMENMGIYDADNENNDNNDSDYKNDSDYNNDSDYKNDSDYNNHSDANEEKDNDEINQDNYILEEDRSYNIHDIIEKDEGNIEYYNSYHYLHFNTLFRSRNNSLLDSIVPATNSNFVLSSPINNISRIKLASINIKKPYVISSSKSNNTFIINKFIKTNDIISCDFSINILIEDGYYDNPDNLVRYLNDNYFDNSASAIEFMRNIHFSINENSNRVSFELSNNYITVLTTDDADFHYFSVDFKSNYTKYYSLATILGFDYNKSAKYYTSINESSNDRINNSLIKSPYNFTSKGNTELFFCLDEFHSNIVETHKLFLNNNMSTQKILAKIDSSQGTTETKNYITEIYSQTDTRNDHTREYDGIINLLNFNIKIIDYYGNIVNPDMMEDFTFTLEVKINNSRLIKNKHNKN